MATVTKLKAEVLNKNLPILGEDGKLYSYYVGRFMNKLLELGYTLTNSQITFLNAFIESGINNGWIEKVHYLMPFIGSIDSRLAGLVPLIDNVADYELAVDSISENAFTYSNDEIVAFGNNESAINTRTILPFGNTDLPDNDFSMYINVNYTIDMLSSAEVISMSAMASIDNGDELCAGIRFGGSENSMQQYKKKPDGTTSSSYILGTNQSDVCQLGAWVSSYVDNDEVKYKRYVIKKGLSVPESKDFRGVAGNNFKNGTYCLGQRNLYSSIPFNIFAVLNSKLITEQDMLSFNQAVFDLTTALGR